MNHTKNWQRIVIWVITIAMAAGSLGFYFFIILQNGDRQNTQSQASASLDANQQKQEATVDPTAYKVDGPVSSLQKTDLIVGTGTEVKAGDTVTVQYKGTLAQTGVKFDSSYDRGEPITFSLNGVIPGWRDGVPGMKIGGKRRLVVPAALAYGSDAQPGIPANSDLVFEIELLAVNPPQQ